MRHLFFLFALSTPFISNAQKKFRPGYIVNLKGDTISGFIDYKEWNVSPTHISFKSSDKDATAKEYTITDVSFFDITGNEAYRRSVVKISLHPAKLTDVGLRDTSWKIDTVFLKVIYSGKLVSLLSYTDKLKERFYILEDGKQEPTELIMREYLSGEALSLTSESTYKIQLNNLLYARGKYTDEAGKRIEEATYDEDDIKRIVLLINRESIAEEAEEKKPRRAYWFAGAGLHRDKLTFIGDHPMATNPTTSQSAWMPRISAGVDLFANPNVGKFFYRVEAGYQLNKSTVIKSLPDDVKAVYGLSGSTISLRAQVNYAIYNSDKLKIPVGVGIVYNHMSYSKNQYKKVYVSGEENNEIENWLDLRKSTATYFARGSMVFNNKIEASFMYRPYTRLTETIAYSMGRNNMQLQIYYLFRRKTAM
jgi:hypothetical protein